MSENGNTPQESSIERISRFVGGYLFDAIPILGGVVLYIYSGSWKIPTMLVLVGVFLISVRFAKSIKIMLLILVVFFLILGGFYLLLPS